MSEKDIIDRLSAACVGHPNAKIAWPHRLLHDARSEIASLRAALLGKICDENGCDDFACAELSWESEHCGCAVEARNAVAETMAPLPHPQEITGHDES